MRPCKGIFGENWRGFVPLWAREERPLPLRISPLSNFLQPFAVHSHEAVAISQSGLYRALVAMSRLFVYRGVRSPLFCNYYSRWSAVCQHFFQKIFGYFLSPSWECEVATLGRYLVRLAVLGYLTTAFCSLGSLLSRPVFVLTLGGGVAYHLNQYLSVNCKPFSFTL